LLALSLGQATEQLFSDGVLVGIFGVTLWVLYRQDGT